MSKHAVCTASSSVATPSLPPQAGDRGRVDEFGEDHRRARCAATRDKALKPGHDGAAPGHFERGARIQEAVLQIHHQQGRPGGPAAMLGVDPDRACPGSRSCRGGHAGSLPGFRGVDE